MDDLEDGGDLVVAIALPRLDPGNRHLNDTPHIASKLPRIDVSHGGQGLMQRCDEATVYRLHLSTPGGRQVDSAGGTHKRMAPGRGIVQNCCRPSGHACFRLVDHGDHPLERAGPLGELVDKDMGNQVGRAAVVLVYR